MMIEGTSNGTIAMCFTAIKEEKGVGTGIAVKGKGTELAWAVDMAFRDCDPDRTDIAINILTGLSIAMVENDRLFGVADMLFENTRQMRLKKMKEQKEAQA